MCMGSTEIIYLLLAIWIVASQFTPLLFHGELDDVK